MPNKGLPEDTVTKEHVDPITGEIDNVEIPTRLRARDVFIDDLGREIPDPRPMQPPIGYKKQPSMFELIREATAREVALYASNREPESFEEAEDFDVDDDYDPHSPWENEFDPPWSEVRAAIQEEREKAASQPPKEPGGEPARPPQTKPTVPPKDPPADPIA